VWLVARRELRERIKDKSFAISTGVTVFLLLLFLVLPNLLGWGDPTSYRVGTADTEAEQVVAAAVQGGSAFDIEYEAVAVADRAAAEQALRDGELDLAIVGGRLLSLEEPALQPTGILQAAAREVRQSAALADVGIDPAQAQSVLAPAALEVIALDVEQDGGGNEGLAFIAVFILYGQLFGYGYGVASGVVEEKSSRVVEILLSTIAPRHLLAGKAPSACCSCCCWR
jgi:ABC-2 type transport system permease protein